LAPDRLDRAAGGDMALFFDRHQRVVFLVHDGDLHRVAARGDLRLSELLEAVIGPLSAAVYRHHASWSVSFDENPS
jgi:hypothetical protein